MPGVCHRDALPNWPNESGGVTTTEVPLVERTLLISLLAALRATTMETDKAMAIPKIAMIPTARMEFRNVFRIPLLMAPKTTPVRCEAPSVTREHTVATRRV